MTEAALGVRAPEPAAAEALFNRVLPADHLSVRRALTDLHARLSPHVSADVMGRLELVLAEVMNNIVRHGADAARRDGPVRPRRIHLSAACHRNGVACAVTDDGIGLPPACLVAPPSPAHPAGEPLPEGGFGWLIIHGLTRSLVYFREDTRNLLAFNIPAMDEAEG